MREEHARELFWADAEARLLDPAVPHVIRDSKTPSGTVPVSSLRGPIITDALYRTFQRRGLRVRFVYTIDDYDPMDSQTMRQQEATREHMGKPFATIPAPDPAAASDWAEYHAGRFVATFADLGIRPEFHRMRDLYREGKLDPAIDLVLRHAETIRAIHARVANVHHEEGWLPISVICERCGRIGTTVATGYDGSTVAYECRPDYVAWAEGCGNRGRTSPFMGASKLLWNEQWCAQWDYFAVTYEEGGKDLLTAGGSRERSNEIYRAVWRREPPPGLMHEFFLLGGKKMSTSKGIGASAHDMVALLPGEIIRFLMLRTHPRRALEFDPAGNTLPRLYDEYDRCADAYEKDPESDLAKVWWLAQLSGDAQPIAFRVRFSLLADWIQIPSVDPQREARERKGSPLSEPEDRELRRRLDVARAWLERWAPEDAKFGIASELPALTLSAAQRSYLHEVAKLAGVITGPEAMQQELYEVAKRVGLVTPEGKVSRDAFAALYRAFIGKPDGPRAGWLLTALDPAFVRERLEDAAAA
ncbi:MAG: lysine--tRNA ligase [Actinobacteria bacterium]|nr:lysine--tRNA ligase [Actinomycetota bacterium]